MIRLTEASKSIRAPVFYSYLKSSCGSSGLPLKGKVNLEGRIHGGLFSIVAKNGNYFAVVEKDRVLGVFALVELESILKVDTSKGPYLKLEFNSKYRKDLEVEGLVISAHFKL